MVSLSVSGLKPKPEMVGFIVTMPSSLGIRETTAMPSLLVVLSALCIVAPRTFQSIDMLERGWPYLSTVNVARKVSFGSTEVDEFIVAVGTRLSTVMGKVVSGRLSPSTDMVAVPADFGIASKAV